MQFEPYADSTFPKEFQKNLAQRSWELYLGITLLSRGFGLGDNGPRQPDLDVQISETGHRLAWIEATFVEKGTGIDKVPETELEKACDALIDQVLLRLANGIQKKHKSYLAYLKNGIVKEDEPFVIAINGSELRHVSEDPLSPLILKALFGIGSLVIDAGIGNDPPAPPNHSWNSRPSVDKKSKASVDMLFCREQCYEGISAVMYCTSDIFNGPYLPKELGENICVVHNPLATNPLPSGFVPFGDE